MESSKGSGENLARLTQPPNISVKKEREVAMNRNSDIPPASPAQPYGPGYYINNFQHMTPTQSRFIQNSQASPNDLPTRPSTPFQIPQFSSPMLSPASQIQRSYSPQRGYLPQRLYAQYPQAATGYTNTQLQQVQNHLISQGLIQGNLPLIQQQLSPIPLGVVSPPIIPPSTNPPVRPLKQSHRPHKKTSRRRHEKKGSRNLYVANLPKDFSGGRLQEMFAPFGKITRSRVTNNASGHLSYAFVEFQNIADARNAILSLDNTQVDKETISVTVALQKTHSNPNLPPTNVYIRGTILKGSTMKEIHTIFGKFGKIVQARILNSKQGIVFVRFGNTHDASACINYYKTHSSEIENIGFAHRNRKQNSNADIPWNRPTIPTAPVNHERKSNSSINMFQVPSQEDFDAVAGLESTRSNNSNYSQGGTSVRVEELNILTLLLAKYWGSFGNVLFPMLFPETRMLISNPLYFQQRTTQMYTILKSREAKAKNQTLMKELVKVNITGQESDTGAKTTNADFLPATPPTMTQSNYETRYWKDFKVDNIDFEAVQKEYGPLMMSTPLTECSSMSSLHLHNHRNLSAYPEAHYSNEAQLQALHLHGYSPSPIPHIPSKQGLMSGPTLPNLRSDQRADVPLQPMQMYRNAQYQSQPNRNDNLRQRSNSTPDLASSGSLTRTGPETSLLTPITNPNDTTSSSTSLCERREVGDLKLQ